MTTLYILAVLAAVLILGFVFFYWRYIKIRFGLKDSNNGAVQHSRRAVPPPSAEDLFLPGSHMEQDQQEILMEHIKNTPQIEQISPNRKKKKLFRNKEDIKRAYIADALLDKPKWSENNKRKG